MRQAGLFAAGVLAQAAFGVVAVLVTRSSFRVWPAGSYTWVPALLALAGLLVLAGLGYALASRGLGCAPVGAAWLVGRVVGSFASAVIPGVGIDGGLLRSASFGLLVVDAGRLTLGVPDVLPLLAHLAVLSLACVLGRRQWHDRSMASA